MLELNDVKVQLLEAKKIILKLQNENSALKVNLRKTKESMCKKERLIDNLVDPKKPNYFSKELSIRGTSLVINLMEENEHLKRELSQKDVAIKKLQREMDSIKAYSNLSNSTFKRLKSSYQQSVSHLHISSGKSTTRSINKLSVRSTKEKLRTFTETDSGLRISLVNKKSQGNDFCELTSPNLNENAENVNSPTDINNIVKSLQNLEKFLSTFNPENKNTTEILLNNGDEFHEDLPHEEIKLLHNSFNDIICEVKSLKSSLMEVQRDQDKVRMIMEEKDSEFEELSKKVQDLVNNCVLNKLSSIIRNSQLNVSK